jgi:hypothetical protein
MIMMSAMRGLLEGAFVDIRKSLLVFIIGLLAGCNFEAVRTAVPTHPSPFPTISPTITQTPFMPVSATPTPENVRIWISPALPDLLQNPLKSMQRAGGRRVEIVDDASLADVRAEPNAQVPLTQWVYAMVAPFPSIPDGMSLEELRSNWVGDTNGFPAFFVSSATAPALKTILGDWSETQITIVEESELLEQAWMKRPSLAIVPFEALEPRWKVLELDGMSPLHLDFDPLIYGLTVPFGLSGNPLEIEIVAREIGWPASNRDPDRLTVLVMTGVTALTRDTAWKMETKGILYPAEKIGDWLKQADLTHVSNEVAFWDSCQEPQPGRLGMSFCSQPEYAELLEAIGVDIIELTGNHLNDFGTEGLSQSLALYRENGWLYFGGGDNLERAMQPVLIEHHGNRLAFLGCNAAGPPSDWATETSPGAAPCDKERLYDELKQLKEQGYLPIFTFQWMEYYDPYPSSSQMRDFRAAIDAGAVIVSGSQAHRPQSFEFYDDGFIHYGLGNLFFDQMWSLGTRQEFIDRYIFYDGRHISTELLTALLEDYSQPRPMTAEERQDLLQEIFAASGW